MVRIHCSHEWGTYDISLSHHLYNIMIDCLTSSVFDCFVPFLCSFPFVTHTTVVCETNGRPGSSRRLDVSCQWSSYTTWTESRDMWGMGRRSMDSSDMRHCPHSCMCFWKHVGCADLLHRRTQISAGVCLHPFFVPWCLIGCTGWILFLNSFKLFLHIQGTVERNAETSHWIVDDRH